MQSRTKPAVLPSTPAERAPYSSTRSHAINRKLESVTRLNKSSNRRPDRGSPNGAVWSGSPVPAAWFKQTDSGSLVFTSVLPVFQHFGYGLAGSLRHVTGFPASDYYGASAPPVPSGDECCPFAALAARHQGDTGWFPRSSQIDRRARRPALPLRHRHGYAADLHRGLPTGCHIATRGSPSPHSGVGYAPRSAHIARFELVGR